MEGTLAATGGSGLRGDGHRPPGLPGGEGERTKPPCHGSCGVFLYEGPSLWGSHKLSHAELLGTAAGRRGPDGARGVHSAPRTPSLSNQLKAKPAPTPRPFPQCK